MRLLNPDNRLLILARKGGRLPAVPTAIAVTFVILVVAGFAVKSLRIWCCFDRTELRDLRMKSNTSCSRLS